MPEEAVLAAVLSALLASAFLGVVAIGLMLVLKALQSIRGWLQKIAMGVRAIEKETAIVPAEVDRLVAIGERT